MLEYVNHLGVDLDFAPNDHFLEAKARFLCGLGPIKAREFLNKLKNTSKLPQSRAEIQNLQWFSPNVLEAVIGFIKFKFSPELEGRNGLDATRIHLSGKLCNVLSDSPFQDYPFAIELCRKCSKYLGNMELEEDYQMINLVINSHP